MTAKSEASLCEFCKNGHISQRTREVAFRQWSDKGYVHCRVSLMVGICDHCQASTPAAGADRIFDEAFQREYNRLKAQSSRCATQPKAQSDLACAISAFLASAASAGGHFRCDPAW
jgi:hypothetical protein